MSSKRMKWNGLPFIARITKRAGFYCWHNKVSSLKEKLWKAQKSKKLYKIVHIGGKEKHDKYCIIDRRKTERFHLIGTVEIL